VRFEWIFWEVPVNGGTPLYILLTYLAPSVYLCTTHDTTHSLLHQKTIFNIECSKLTTCLDKMDSYLCNAHVDVAWISPTSGFSIDRTRIWYSTAWIGDGDEYDDFDGM
jgi:hypothetical protein